MVLSAFLMMAATGSSVVGPYLVKVAIDDGLTAGNPIALRNAVLLYLVLAIVRWIFIYTRVNIMARVGQAVIYDLRKEMFEHLQNLSLSFYSRYSVGRVITRVINDVENLRQFIIWAVLAIARDLFALVGIIIAMLALDVKLSLLTFITLPLMLLATASTAARRASLIDGCARPFRGSIRCWRKISTASAWCRLFAPGAQLRQFPRYHQRYHLQTLVRAAKVAASFLPIVDVLGALATAVVVYLGGTAVSGRVDHGGRAGGFRALY